MQRCYVIARGHGKGTLIPGCWGAAVYGAHRCTCDAASERENHEERIQALEEKVRVLMESLTPRR